MEEPNYRMQKTLNGLTNKEGGCLCGDVRFKLKNEPMFIQACHCLDCQRISGSAFIINMWIESRFVEITNKPPVSFMNKGGSGSIQEIYCCGNCGTDLWSCYHAGLKASWFVRVGLLDDPTEVVPQAHIYTRSKQKWIKLPDDKPHFEAFYNIPEVWPQESLQRLKSLKKAEQLKAQQ